MSLSNGRNFQVQRLVIVPAIRSCINAMARKKDVVFSFNPRPPSDAVRKRTHTHKKDILEDLFSSVLLQLKKYQPLET